MTALVKLCAANVKSTGGMFAGVTSAHRSWRSEQHAFERLGLHAPPRVTERELVQEFSGLRVPEGIFDHDAKVLSIEVKRIVGTGCQPAGGRSGSRARVTAASAPWPWVARWRSP